jgi:Tol biopolymer transport system component
VSSDGRFAAFVKRGECRDDVYVYDVARGRVLPMTGDIAPPGAAGCTGDLARFDRPVLDATGRAVWFLRHDEGQEYARSYVLRRDVATGALTTVAELAGAQSTEGYDISADGRRVVYVGSTNGTVEGTAPSGSAVFTVEAGGKPVRLSPAPPMPVMQCHGSLAQTCTDSAQQPSMSADGSVIAFVTNVPISDADRTVTRDVYLAT